MSTAASTTTSSAAPSSLATSAKFRAFAVVAAITIPIVYVICDVWNLPAFTYHPAVGRVDLGWAAARSGEGPAMYWYGWSVTTLFIAGVLGLIATFLPASLIKKIPLTLIWLLPVIAYFYLIYTLLPFWTHQ